VKNITKKKILMLNYEFPPLGGGAANANFYLLKEFAKNKNLEIDLITSSANNKYEEEQFSENIKIYKLDVHKKDLQYWKVKEIFSWSMQAYKLSKKLIKEKEYDLCHCWFGWPSGVIGYLNRQKVPYIVALRGSDVPGHNPRFKYYDALFLGKLSKIVWNNARDLITNSEGLKQDSLKVLKRKIIVIPNGIDLKKFKPAHKKSSKNLRIISTGRLNRVKGYDYLIKAISNNPQIRLTLIGDGNLKQELEALAKKYNSNVNFKRQLSHEEIPKKIQKADIFASSSLNEGMSNSVLEAMATGLPIITTNVGGAWELISGNGFVVETASVEQLKKAILNYQSNPKLIRKHGKQSRKLVEKMGWEKIGKQYGEIYFESK